MMNMMKKLGIWSGITAVLSTLFFLVGGWNATKKAYIDYVEWSQTHRDHEEVRAFDQSSGIIGHTLIDGKVRLKYKTCNPPVDAPFYYYTVWRNGLPVEGFNRTPTSGHFDINSWFQPIQCTEGWLGSHEFDGEPGDTFVVTWYFQVDGGYDAVIMRYTITK